jgi:hypothetical protein
MRVLTYKDNNFRGRTLFFGSGKLRFFVEEQLIVIYTRNFVVASLEELLVAMDVDVEVLVEFYDALEASCLLLYRSV